MMKRMLGRWVDTALPVPTKISASSAPATPASTQSAALAAQLRARRRRVVFCIMDATL